MKVLVLPSWYPSKSYPNNGVFFKEQVEALANNGIDVTVLCVEIPYRKTKKDYKYFKENIYVENGIEVHRYILPLSFLHRMPQLYYLFLKTYARYLYKRNVRGKEFDAIHAHSFLIGGYLGNKLKKNIKCIITEHSSKILTDALNNVEKKILKECIKECDSFVCVSNNLKIQLEKMVGKSQKLFVYPNIVNKDFVFVPKEDRGEFLFASIGNLIPLKRMDLLIRSFCKAFAENEKVRLEIIGEGKEKTKLEQLIRENGREHQVELKGMLARKEVVQRLQLSHAMALLSEKETFGVSYIEALATGNVIVGVNNGGANDIITSENGLMAHYTDENKIAESLRYVYENYSLYDSKKISRECLHKYGDFDFSQFYKKLYQQKL